MNHIEVQMKPPDKYLRNAPHVIYGAVDASFPETLTLKSAV
jgi:hypothetical protein